MRGANLLGWVDWNWIKINCETLKFWASIGWSILLSKNFLCSKALLAENGFFLCNIDDNYIVTQ